MTTPSLLYLACLPLGNGYKKAKNIYSWINWICCTIKPFSVVEDKLNRQYTTLEPISVNTLKKYIQLLRHAPIIQSKGFETKLVKNQDGKVNKLDVDEVVFTKCFQVTAVTQDINAESDSTSNFAESIMKKRKLERTA